MLAAAEGEGEEEKKKGEGGERPRPAVRPAHLPRSAASAPPPPSPVGPLLPGPPRGPAPPGCPPQMPEGKPPRRALLPLSHLVRLQGGRARLGGRESDPAVRSLLGELEGGFADGGSGGAEGSPGGGGKGGGLVTGRTPKAALRARGVWGSGFRFRVAARGRGGGLAAAAAAAIAAAMPKGGEGRTGRKGGFHP